MEPDLRNYVNPHPRHSEAVQRAAMPQGAVYVEDRTGTVIQRLIKSLRKDSIVRVYRPFLLAPIKGRPERRRRLWCVRVEMIRAKGGKFVTVQPLSPTRMAMVAYEEIASSGRGAPGREKSGRPSKAYTPEQRVIIEREWNSRKHKTRKAALAAIKSYGIDVKLTWLYTHVK